MRVERLTVVAVGVVLALATLAVVAPSLATTPGQGAGAAVGQTSQGPLDALAGTELVDLALWATTGLFALTALVWVVLTYVVGAGYEPPEAVHGGDDVQVRILTIDAEEVVQATVDSLPAELADVHVVAEEAIDVAGADVHVVPDGFECEAVRKGRAIEWARRTLGCEKEYVLYLDEDSLLEEFEGLPDADIVQLREAPRRTGSVLSYLADVYRMGVQIEQRAFARLSIPLFAWGGGIAVRAELEDEVTWDRETLVEDTAFVWAAARQFDVQFDMARATCRNEAPPSLEEITQQRRRWAAGNLEAASMLPTRYRVLTRVRNLAWALSPVVSLFAVPFALLGVGIVYSGLFFLTSLTLGAFTAFWYLRGVVYYGADEVKWTLALPVAPVVSLVHSLGTVVGILHPPDGFRVTEKVGTDA